MGCRGPRTTIETKMRSSTLPIVSLPLLLLLLSIASVLGQQPFDHSSQHCHDVSIWGELEYKDMPCSKCTTKFEKECEEKNMTVCAMVPVVNCSLVPYTECSMFMMNTTFNETEVINDSIYRPIVCVNDTREETHIKMIPECVEVERQDCVTKWVLTPSGEKIWDGNEQCTPVKWQNCTLVPTPKKFNQTYTKCEASGTPVPTMECRLTERTKLVTGMRCEVRHNVDCTSEHIEECMECMEAPKPIECSETVIPRPFQRRIHRVKCLLDNENESPNLDVEESAENAEQILQFPINL